MDQIALTIDGQKVMTGKGTSVLEAALGTGIYIPHLCHDPDLKPYGACRLCVVEIEGMRGLPTACTMAATEGLVVRTDTSRVNQVRRVTVELLLADHPMECLTCPASASCGLLRVASYLGIDHIRFKKSEKAIPIDDSNPFFYRDLAKCVLCARCVRACQEIEGVGAIDFAFRGYLRKVATFGDKPLAESRCESCGECLVRCPVGALAPKRRDQPAREVKTLCPYCGVGCGIYLGVRGNTVVSARGDPDNPVNRGVLCVKGRFGHDFINHPDRLTTPLVRRNRELVPASWEEALDLVARRFAPYRGDQFALAASAKCTNEENYLFQKFARAVMGTNNVDHCARLCHAPSVAGLAQTLGSGAMTNPIDDLEETACVLAIGTNTTATHPVIGMRLRKAVQNGAKLIVINPREIELCRYAHLWLRQRPGSDVALLLGMMKVIVDEGLQDSAFIEARTQNFGVLKECLEGVSMGWVEQVSGVSQAQVVEAARTYAQSKPATILYGMGITQHSHGTDNVLAISNLSLLTGNLGKPGSGVNPLRGQNNVQGACDMGALPNVYPGYQAVGNSALRERFEAAWGCHLNPTPGLTTTEIFHPDYSGKIKALYIIGENPVLSEPNAHHAEQVLREVDFLVVQDIFLTETARLAEVVLPGASFAEKEGTFTNTERQVQRIRKAIEPVGNSRPDWWITCELARRMEGLGFDFQGPSEIMKEIASVTPSYSGISYPRLEKGSLIWPCPGPEHPGTPLLHSQRFPTSSGKALFVSLSYRPPAEVPDE
ncbi:MAG: formate dehydrogenase subunit alpha, partial [Chloroflexota bacterium]